MNDIRFKRKDIIIARILKNNILSLQNELKQLKKAFCDNATEYFLNNEIIGENYYDKQNGKTYKLVILLGKDIEAYCVACPNDSNSGKTFNISVTLLESVLGAKLPDWYHEHTKYVKYGFETFELAKEEALNQLEYVCMAVDIYNNQNLIPKSD